jgi:NADH:ubiquinone oxidoreductase subunit E
MTTTPQDSPCGENHNPQFAELDQFIATMKIDPKDPRRKDKLITILHRAQEIFGYLPVEVQLHIAKKLTISHSEVSGVISFYNFFTTEPKGKIQVNVCLGTACYVNGSDKVLSEFESVLGIKSGQVTPDGKFSIESLRCVGACGLAPVVTINHKVYGKVKPGDVREILEKYVTEEDLELQEASHA